MSDRPYLSVYDPVRAVPDPAVVFAPAPVPVPAASGTPPAPPPAPPAGPSGYIDGLVMWGMFALATIGVLVANALVSRWMGPGVPPLPAPPMPSVFVVSPADVPPLKVTLVRPE